MAAKAVMDQKYIVASSDLREAEVIFAEAYPATSNPYARDRDCGRGRSFPGIRQPTDNSCPAPDTAVKAPQIVLFVGRMNGIIFECKTNQYAVHLQDILKMPHDGYRSARTDHNGIGSKFVLKPGGRGGDEAIVLRHRSGRTSGLAAEARPAVFRQQSLDMPAQCGAQLSRILPADQPAGNLRSRFRGQHGLGALAGVAAVNSVDL